MPPPYIFYSNTSANFDFEGESIDLGGPDKTWSTNDPCQALRFVARYHDETNRGLKGDRETRATYDEVERECRATGGGSGGIPPPPTPTTPPPVEDPSTTGSDTPAPEGQGTTQTLGAPEGSAQGQLSGEPTAPGESDGRPLPQQYCDPRNPMPDYDLRAILSFQGVPPGQLNDALQDVIQNEPLPGLPHWDFGNGDRENVLPAAEPVDAFSGEYYLSVTEVQIPSRGFPLQLTRLYRSGPVYFGPWGYNWDHNYNVYLRELFDEGVAIWTGQLSEHVYQRNPEGGFEPLAGIFNQLEHRPASPTEIERYTLTDRDGMQQIFERPDGWPYPDRIPLVRIEDRHSNAHLLSYDAEGRLDRVEDHAGRFIKFMYGDCGLLEQVTDHTGRLWRYFHDDEIEHLVAVITPATPEYPEGLKTCYEYDRFRTHPALLHNLTKVIDPAGQVVVENWYGDNPDTDDFARVVYQEFSGFVATFSATRLQYVPRVPEAINVPALRVEIVYQGFLNIYTFNYRGDLLDERFRLVRDGSYRLVARVYRYDEQGNLIEQREPNGLGVLYDYDHENPDPRARANLLRISLSAPPTRPAPGREMGRFTYEPRYHRLKAVRDESRAVTTFIYDYEETTTDRGDVIRIEHPMATLPDGSTQECQEHFTYNNFGQLTERRSGEDHLFTYEYYIDGPANGYLKRTVAGVGMENQSQDFGYDQFGNLSGVTDASGAATEYERNVIGQLIRLRKPLGDGLRGEVVYNYGRDGRLKSQETPRGSYQDRVIADPFIRHEFEFDVLGHIRSAVYGANTAHPRRWRIQRTADGFPCEIVDPLGRVIRLEYDERNLLLRQTLFVGTPEERSIRFINDRNGNRIRVIDPAGREMEDRYDSFDRLREVVFPGVEGERTRVIYRYGERDQIERVETIGVQRPGRPPILLSELNHQFDERGRLLRRAQGPLSGTFWYDRDSCLRQVVNERGNSVRFTCDALGRMRTAIDPLGNQISYTFDSRGNLVAVDESEVGPGLAMPETYHTEIQYDARSRLMSIIDLLGNTVTSEYDDRDLMVAVNSPLGNRNEYDYDMEGLLILARGFTSVPPLPVEYRWQRDLGGRVTKYIDPEGKQTQYEYNLEDRWSKIIMPDSTGRVRLFDSSGQLTREIAPSNTASEFSYGPDGLVERVHFIASPGVVELPDLEYQRDGLGKPVQTTQGGMTLDLEYDPLGRLLSESMAGSSARLTYDDINGLTDLTYPDGRMDRYQLDALGRINQVTLHQLALNPLTGPTLAPRALLARYEYVGPQRLLRRVSGNGCKARYSYDRGRRLAGIEHRTADDNLLALVQYVYDAAGRRRVLRVAPAPGMSTLFEYDQLSRLHKVAEGIAAPEPPPQPTQAQSDAYVLSLGSPAAQRNYEYSLNRADARSQKTLIEPAGTTIELYSLNDLHQITQLIRTTPLTSSTYLLSHDLDGRRTRDDRYTYTYDAMGHLVEVRSVADSSILLRQEYDPAGRIFLRTLGTSAPTRIRHLGARALQDETIAGDPLRQRCFGINVDELIAQSENNERWGHQDARLSLLAISDNTGHSIERYSYTPFGTPIIWAADGITPRMVSGFGMAPIFGGHLSMGLNGLYHARARVYDANTGVFLQRDPRGNGNSANLYAYVGHNPVDLIDPSGEIAPIIAVLFIIGVLAGVGYTTHDAIEHPERYQGAQVFWRGPAQVGASAAVGAATGFAGEAVLATVGIGSLAAGGTAAGTGIAAGGTLSLGQTLVLGGTVSVTSGYVWRSGISGIFPELADPPSAGTMATDYVFGAGLSGGFRALEAISYPSTWSGRWWTVRLSVREAGIRTQMRYQRIIGNANRAEQLGRDIADVRVQRLHADELRDANVQLDSLVYQIPGEGQWVVFNPEIDAVTNSAWIQVRAGEVPGRTPMWQRGLRGSGAQALYTAYGSPTRRSIYYVEQGEGYLKYARRLLERGISEVRPLTPPLRGTEPFPLPFGGASGIPAARMPWFLLTPDSTPPGGGATSGK